MWGNKRLGRWRRSAEEVRRSAAVSSSPAVNYAVRGEICFVTVGKGVTGGGDVLGAVGVQGNRAREKKG